MEWIIALILVMIVPIPGAPPHALARVRVYRRRESDLKAPRT